MVSCGWKPPSFLVPGSINRHSLLLCWKSDYPYAVLTHEGKDEKCTRHLNAKCFKFIPRMMGHTKTFFFFFLSQDMGSVFHHGKHGISLKTNTFGSRWVERTVLWLENNREKKWLEVNAFGAMCEIIHALDCTQVWKWQERVNPLKPAPRVHPGKIWPNELLSSLKLNSWLLVWHTNDEITFLFTDHHFLMNWKEESPVVPFVWRKQDKY